MSTSGHTNERPAGKKLAFLSLVALGIVYGDIGTSPLYALRECFHGDYAIAVTEGHVLGVLSLIFWSLVFVISLKYLYFILKADNDGEGGILALMALLVPRARLPRTKRGLMIAYLGLFGAALLYGDGMITPAISVLGAVEGLNVATDFFKPYVIPITIVILAGLFLFQRRGTAVVGSLFGPVMLVWFTTIAALGAWSILDHPMIVRAISPLYAVQFLLDGGWSGYLVLGFVFLVVTGGEALYADLGHFGTRPIRIGWYSFVLPCLLLNYFGQGAWLIHNPHATSNTFYALAPSWGIYPLVVIATAATVIASQAIISGVFSLTMQAVQFGYSPRMQIDHTSEAQHGQIYIPSMNWIMFFATVGLVLGFQSSSNLAAAYGVAVSITMVITTVLFFDLAVRRWNWPVVWTSLLCIVFLVVDLAFFGANIIKFLDGGWFPLLVAGVLFVIAITWKRGRQLLTDRISESLEPIDQFLDNLEADPPTRIPGTAVYMTSHLDTAPLAMIANLGHNRVLHEQVVMLCVSTEDEPVVDRDRRVETNNLREGFMTILIRCGFMEEPNVPRILQRQSEDTLLDLENVTYYLGREFALASERPGMALWRERIFSRMLRNELKATAYFHLPSDRVFEVGTQIKI